MTSAASNPEEKLRKCEYKLTAEPKAKGTFVHLPKSTFVLDELECKSSNKNTLAIVLHTYKRILVESTSPCGMLNTVYLVLTQTFMSCSLIAGKLDSGWTHRKRPLFGINHGYSFYFWTLSLKPH